MAAAVAIWSPIGPPLEMVEAQLVFQFPVLLLDGPAAARQADKLPGVSADEATVCRDACLVDPHGATSVKRLCSKSTCPSHYRV
jgi:hypothetical protein